MNIPWVDKYRPVKLDHIIYQNEVVRVLRDTIKTGELPNLLFYGPPGTGKTSTILALGYELFGPKIINDRIMELNASDERGIDTVRDKIMSFAKETICSPDPNYPCPPYKIIILDEADAITLDAQSALRKIIETSSHITRFCFTCNYIEKIIEPIVSRCVKFRFKPISKQSIIDRLKLISINEKIKITDECYTKIYENSEGDARRAIMILQNVKYVYNIKKNISIEDINNILGTTQNDTLEEIWKNITTQKIKDVYKITQNIKNNCINLSDLLAFLNTKILSSNIADNNKGEIICIIGNTETRLIEGGDEFINILYCLSYINFFYNNN